jgi:hypothetical protein
VKHEAVDANLLISCNADALDQAFLVAKRTQSTHEPAIPLLALPDIVGAGAADEEARLLEYVLDAFDRHWPKVSSDLIQAHQTVRILPGIETTAAARSKQRLSPQAKVGLDVKMRISVLYVQPAALPCDLLDLCNTSGAGLIVPAAHRSTGKGPRRVQRRGGALGVEVVRKHGMRLSRKLGGEAGPEGIDCRLSRLQLAH